MSIHLDTLSAPSSTSTCSVSERFLHHGQKTEAPQQLGNACTTEQNIISYSLLFMVVNVLDYFRWPMRPSHRLSNSVELRMDRPIE